VTTYTVVECPNCGRTSARANRGNCVCGALVGPPTRYQEQADVLKAAGWERVGRRTWRHADRPGLVATTPEALAEKSAE
jgi:hypothetical protein